LVTNTTVWTPINAENIIFYINFLIQKAVKASGKINLTLKNPKESKVKNLSWKEADYIYFSKKM